MSTALSSAPTPWKPLRIAYADAPRKLLLKTFSARVKSSASRTRSAVSTVGAPSLYSSVPMRVSTFSGVVIPGGLAVDVCAQAKLGRASVEQAANRASGLRICIMASPSFFGSVLHVPSWGLYGISLYLEPVVGH